jgi:exopolysaccharide biosynthesis protein
MIVQDGRVLPDQESQTQPRTAIGVDKRGKNLVIVVVDGRQPGYSEGATLAELASFLVEHGVYTGMNLDGGGSSTLVMERGGRPAVLNSPINNGIPGRERPVGNHLGIFAEPEN